MAPNTKTKSKAISASSFLELKAELAKKEEDLTKLKAAGHSTTVQGAKRTVKVSICIHGDSEGLRTDIVGFSDLRNPQHGLVRTMVLVLERQGILNWKQWTNPRSSRRVPSWNEKQKYMRSSGKGRQGDFLRISTILCW